MNYGPEAGPRMTVPGVSTAQVITLTGLSISYKPSVQDEDA